MIEKEAGKRKKRLEQVVILNPMPLKLITELRPFQESILRMIERDPDDRSINWVIDRKGNTGKTEFLKLLVIKHGACAFTGGCASYIAQTLRSFVYNKDGSIRVDLNAQKTPMLFDLTKCVDKISWCVLEEIKNGLVVCPKYENGCMLFNSPHVWIMSNIEPDYEKLTEDRWLLWTINDDSELIEFAKNL